MLLLRNSLLIFFLALVPALAQMDSGDSVKRVGARIACQCGSCSHTVARCDMYGCFSQKAREKIGTLQAAGLSDQAIVDQFVKEFGQSIYRAEPNAFGWVVPILSILLGLALIFWFVRRYRRPAVAAPQDDAVVSQYRERIEQDVARLD